MILRGERGPGEWNGGKKERVWGEGLRWWGSKCFFPFLSRDCYLYWQNSGVIGGGFFSSFFSFFLPFFLSIVWWMRDDGWGIGIGKTRLDTLRFLSSSCFLPSFLSSSPSCPFISFHFISWQCCGILIHAWLLIILLLFDEIVHRACVWCGDLRCLLACLLAGWLVEVSLVPCEGGRMDGFG